MSGRPLRSQGMYKHFSSMSISDRARELRDEIIIASDMMLADDKLKSSDSSVAKLIQELNEFKEAANRHYNTIVSPLASHEQMGSCYLALNKLSNTVIEVSKAFSQEMIEAEKSNLPRSKI